VSTDPTPDTTLRDRIAAAIWAQYPDAEPSRTGLVLANPHAVADAVLAAPADLAADALREAADFYDQVLKDMGTDVGCDPRYWTAIRDVVLGLRRRADDLPELRRLADETPAATDEAPCSDPIECSHEGALGEAEAEAERQLAAVQRVRRVLEVEPVLNRSALEYRGLILNALMGTAPAAGARQDEDRLRCPQCGEDITDYDMDDHVFRTGDERPYCSGECVIAMHRAVGTREKAHTEGEHAFCGDECMAEQPAAEAQQQGDEALRAKVDEATATLRRVRSKLNTLKDQGAAGRTYYQVVTEALAGPRPDEAQQQDDTETRSGCPDPIECSHEAALGEAALGEAALGEAEEKLDAVHALGTAWSRPSMSAPIRAAGQRLLRVLGEDTAAAGVRQDGAQA
jgi:hypothetical protein